MSVADIGMARPGEVFARLGADYAAARPGYPDELFEALWERLCARVRRIPLCLDVAAGTGAATASLLARGARVAAVEPVLGMLSHARDRSRPQAGWLGGIAARGEALPVRDTAIDAITVAQAFHWLDEAAALAEFARALAPAGILAIVWNIAEANAFTREVWALVKEMNPGHKRPVHDEKRATPDSLAAHPDFEVEAPLEFPHARSLTADEYVRYTFSWSYVGGALGANELAAFERGLRTIIARHHGSGPYEERLLAVAHFARRR